MALASPEEEFLSSVLILIAVVAVVGAAATAGFLLRLYWQRDAFDERRRIFCIGSQMVVSWLYFWTNLAGFLEDPETKAPTSPENIAKRSLFVWTLSHPVLLIGASVADLDALLNTQETPVGANRLRLVVCISVVLNGIVVSATQSFGTSFFLVALFIPAFVSAGMAVGGLFAVVIWTFRTGVDEIRDRCRSVQISLDRGAI